MIDILVASATTENSGQMDGGDLPESGLIFSVVGATWTGTIKAAARIRGRGKAGDSTYPIYLPILNLSTGAVVAAGTGVSADGIYAIATNGMEVRLEHTRAAGSVTVYGNMAELPELTLVTLETGDIEIGKAKLLGADGSTVAKIGALSALAASDNGIPVATYPIASEVHQGEMGGKGLEARDEFTRPNDATPYAADDVISADTSDTGTTPLRGLTLARKQGGTGYIRYWEISTDHTTFLPRIRVHLFTVAAPTTAVPGDNVLMVRKYANMPQRVYSFDMPALALPPGAGAHDMVYAIKDDLNVAFKCDAADTKIYYRYELLDAATPAAQKKVYTIARSDVD